MTYLDEVVTALSKVAQDLTRAIQSTQIAEHALTETNPEWALREVRYTENRLQQQAVDLSNLRGNILEEICHEKERSNLRALGEESDADEYHRAMRDRIRLYREKVDDEERARQHAQDLRRHSEDGPDAA